MKRSKCAFLILAGGKSSRMGRCKAELPIGETTFLGYMIQKARTMGFGEILVSGYTACTDGERCGPGVRFIPDVLKERGPLGGMYACFKQAGLPSCFVISVDVPLFAEAMVQRLLEAHEPHSAKATLLVHEERVEPLIGVYNTEGADILYDIIKERSASVFSYLDRIGFRTVELQEPLETIRNFNTPQEYGMLKDNLQF